MQFSCGTWCVCMPYVAGNTIIISFLTIHVLPLLQCHARMMRPFEDKVEVLRGLREHRVLTDVLAVS